MNIIYRKLMVLALLVLAGHGFAQSESETTERVVKEKITTIKEKTTTIVEKKVERKASPLVAIFVKNRAGEKLDDKISVFEDLVTAQITDMKFRVISHEDTVKAMRSFMGAKPDATVPGAKLDELLENNTSSLRLAQQMGVDYIFVLSITTLGNHTKEINRPDLDIKRTIVTHQLRTTYKILDVVLGDSVSAGSILSLKRTQAGGGFSESINVVDELLADAASQVAAHLQEKNGVEGLAAPRKNKGVVSFGVSCSMQDLSVPELMKDKDGNFILGGNRYKLEAMSVTVELDGVVIGSAPGEFQVLPGLHKIRLTREGFKDFERTINVRDGQHLNIPLILTDKGRKNWLEMANFFNGLKSKEKLVEAQVEKMKGYADMLRQSGIRIDGRARIGMIDPPPAVEKKDKPVEASP